jgi:hypothetical protein
MIIKQAAAGDVKQSYPLTYALQLHLTTLSCEHYCLLLLLLPQYTFILQRSSQSTRWHEMIYRGHSNAIAITVVVRTIPFQHSLSRPVVGAGDATQHPGSTT